MDERGIKSPTGDQKLACADCHQTDVSGRSMAPIRMEQHCSAVIHCSSTKNDSSTAVPHGDPKLMFTALEEHFSRMFCSRSRRALGRPIGAGPAASRRS